MKVCTVCRLERSLNEFGVLKKAKDGLRSQCKSCRRAYYIQNRTYIKDKSKAHYHKNITKSRKLAREYYNRNIEERRQYDKLRYERDKVKRLELCKRLYYKDIEKTREKERLRNKSPKRKEYNRNRQQLRRQQDIQFRLAQNLRTRLNRAIEIDQKSGSAVDDLGCSIGQFKLYIENYFPLYPGMRWENYGKEWELDHYIPISSFNLSDRNELLEACHYTNIQPLWCSENRSKSNK